MEDLLSCTKDCSLMWTASSSICGACQCLSTQWHVEIMRQIVAHPHRGLGNFCIVLQLIANPVANFLVSNSTATGKTGSSTVLQLLLQLCGPGIVIEASLRAPCGCLERWTSADSCPTEVLGSWLSCSLLSAPQRRGWHSHCRAPKVERFFWAHPEISQPPASGH